MNLTLHEVAHLVHAKNDISQFEDVALVKPEFDSRLIGPGDLFVPLKGARDGHDFIETAFDNGAVATFSEKVIEGHPYIKHKETTITKLVYLIRYCICQKGWINSSLKWVKTI